jgi:hypothetical protein
MNKNDIKRIITEYDSLHEKIRLFMIDVRSYDIFYATMTEYVEEFFLSEDLNHIDIVMDNSYRGDRDAKTFRFPLDMLSLTGESLKAAVNGLAVKRVEEKRKREEAINARNAEIKLAAERAQYEKLKKKFEGIA